MIRQALRDVRALLFPIECAGCGAHDSTICESCVVQLEPCTTPRTTPAGLVVHTALRYESSTRRIVLAFKEQGRTDVARALSRPLAAALAAATLDNQRAIVVPIPTSRAAYRRRGYDPVRMLLRRAHIESVQALFGVRHTGSQKRLGAEDRAANLSGAFRASRSLVGVSVVLVDDILTTGATLDEAARAIRAAGGTVVGAATMAFTPRLLQNS